MWLEFFLVISLLGNVLSLGYIFSYRHIFLVNRDEAYAGQLLLEAAQRMNVQEIKPKREVL